MSGELAIAYYVATNGEQECSHKHRTRAGAERCASVYHQAAGALPSSPHGQPYSDVGVAAVWSDGQRWAPPDDA